MKLIHRIYNDDEIIDKIVANNAIEEDVVECIKDYLKIKNHKPGPISSWESADGNTLYDYGSCNGFFVLVK